MSHITRITTADGSHSLRNEVLKETYHSIHGAMQESMHVFLRNGMEYFIQQNNPVKLSILEMGFGTGLNALLALAHALNNEIKIFYTSIEAFPLQRDIWSGLNHGETLGLPDAFASIHQSAWNSPQHIAPNFQLLKLRTSLEEASLTEYFDLVFYDAFAPSTQPELWTITILEKIVNTMASRGVLVTYCARGQFKRDLKTLGLIVETLEGPPGKKEMVRATKV